MFLLTAFILVVFMAGLVNLFVLRFQTGDVLPPYSSLRSDPLGAKAFYESLDGLRRVTVSRHYERLSKLEQNEGATVFFLGMPSNALYFSGEEVIRALDAFVMSGGRLVLAFLPVREPGRPEGIGEEIKKAEDPKQGKSGIRKDEEKKKKPDDGESAAEGRKKAGKVRDRKEKRRGPLLSDLFESGSLGRHWGFGFGFDAGLAGDAEPPPARAEVSDLPETVSWHTALYFKDLKKPWRVIYSHRNRPVIMERDWGQGTIVLAADSYLFSNEGLRKEPRPGLLTWMVGPAGDGGARIIFEESHLGMRENPGIASLARKYRLHGLLAGLIVLAALFVWKSSLSLVPPSAGRESEANTVYASERDYNAGLVSLLRSHLPRDKVLETCFREWRRSAEPRRADYGDAVDKARDAIPGNRTDPVKGYKAICQILSEGKKKWKKT